VGRRRRQAVSAPELRAPPRRSHPQRGHGVRSMPLPEVYWLRTSRRLPMPPSPPSPTTTTTGSTSTNGGPGCPRWQPGGCRPGGCRPGGCRRCGCGPGATRASSAGTSNQLARRPCQGLNYPTIAKPYKVAALDVMNKMHTRSAGAATDADAGIGCGPSSPDRVKRDRSQHRVYLSTPRNFRTLLPAGRQTQPRSNGENANERSDVQQPPC
jgi:hypothetical protein